MKTFLYLIILSPIMHYVIALLIFNSLVSNTTKEICLKSQGILSHYPTSYTLALVDSFIINENKFLSLARPRQDILGMNE